MTQLQDLDRNLKRISGDVAKMQKPINRADAAVRDTKSVLAKPRELSISMKWLSSKANTLRNTALFLMPFPVIGTLASRIAKILRSARTTAESTKRAADKLDLEIKPAKDAVSKVELPVKRTKRSLDRAQALLQGWLALTAETERRYGDCPPGKVESVCSAINRALAPEMKAIAEKQAPLTKALDTLGDGFEGVVRASRPVTDALETADEIARSLRPLEGPLTELNKALRPVKWALESFSWVTRKVIDPVVNQILKAVGLNKLVNQLERKLNPLAGIVAPLERAVNSMATSVAKIGNTSKVVASLNGIPRIEKQIVGAMKPLSRVVPLRVEIQ